MSNWKWNPIVIALLALPCTVEPCAAQERPNFVVVLVEGTGAGWASTSVAMDDRLPQAKAAAGVTPELEKLAARGVRFSDFYVSAPRCTPARATLLSGISAAKLGMTYVNEGGVGRERSPGRGKRGDDVEETPSPRKLLTPPSKTELPAETQTIAEVLHEAGYATAHFGKWHVGRVVPARHGFDVDDGANTNQGPGRDPKPNPEQGTAITDRGIAFVREQVKAKKPFYLQLSQYGGGSEDESRPETRRVLAEQIRGVRGKAFYQAAILHEVDQNLGRLLAALEECGARENTWVIVTFDHGASGRNANAPLSGGKGSVREGGIRVPLVVGGPGVAGGRCSHVRATGADLLPTLAELAGVTRVAPAVEGGSLVPLLRPGNAVNAVKRPREEIVIHFPHYDLDNGGPASAIFLGEYKLIRRYEDGVRQLYRVASDPAERDDLAAKEPARVEEMTKRLDAYLTAVSAGMPKPNPDDRR